MYKKIFSLMIFSFVLSGCSLLPYENSSSCNMKKQYGKCIDVEGAYKESVTGEESDAPKLYKLSEGQDEDEAESVGNSEKTKINNSESFYRSYQDERYKLLGSMIKEPKTPMLSPPKTVRTLIISYSPDYDKRRLYMPRYVFSIVEDSKFILGQYESTKSGSIDIFKIK